jgi:hypothetical protein
MGRQKKDVPVRVSIYCEVSLGINELYVDRELEREEEDVGAEGRRNKGDQGTSANIDAVLVKSKSMQKSITKNQLIMDNA